MAEKYELAEIDYNNGMKYKDIAEKYGVTLNTVKSWKTRKWGKDDAEKGVHTKSKKSAHKNEGVKKVVVEELPELNEDNGLTEKQRLFCLHYIRTHNATQSAIMAGYGKASAHTEGSRLLRNVKVVDEIKRLKTPMIEATFADANDFIQLLVKIAFADIGDFVEGGGFGVSLRPVDEIDTSVLSELSNTENGVKIKMENKMKAIELLAKYSNILQPNEREQLAIEQVRVNVDKTKAELAKIEKPEGNKQESEIAKMLRRMAGDEK